MDSGEKRGERGGGSLVDPRSGHASSDEWTRVDDKGPSGTLVSTEEAWKARGRAPPSIDLVRWWRDDQRAKLPSLEERGSQIVS